MNAIIIGGGQIGIHMASSLLDSGCHVRVIEDEKRLSKDSACPLPADTLIPGDYADPDIMEQAGIKNADVVAVVTDSDGVNLVASTIAKYEFAVPRVIALANQQHNHWLFTREMGVDIYVSQAHLLARTLVNTISFSNMVTLMKLNSGTHSITQFPVEKGSFADGNTVSELLIPDDSALIALQLNGQVIAIHGETTLHAGDYVLALISENSQHKINTLFSAKQ